MEIGNLMFGISRGEYEFPNRDLVKDESWTIIDKVTDLNFENDVFKIKPYDWSGYDTTPNFIYKPTGLTIMWYKYPFRDAYTNREISEETLREIFKICVGSISAEVDEYSESHCKSAQEVSDTKRILQNRLLSIRVNSMYGTTGNHQSNPLIKVTKSFDYDIADMYPDIIIKK